MVKSSILGYPVIGENREWKRALEAFWSKKITEEELLQTTKEIRLHNLKKQKEAGVEQIPVGDFTLYDRVLDTSAMFGIIPSRYQWKGGPVSTAQYFSMARGNDDAVASEMTKWFNTNYHYIVPEYEGQRFQLTENKPLAAYREAKQELNIEGKPVLLGPYTLLKLSKGYEDKDVPAIILQLIPLYQQILQELQEEGVKWVQIDEPILCTSISADEMKAVTEIYLQLTKNIDSLNIMLQTYFDSVEHYGETIALPVAGIGLDFVHGGKKNLENLTTHGFPGDKILGAGIVDGRNIWRSDLDVKLSLLQTIKQYTSAEKLWIQPSCSLLHVPVTIRSEQKLDSVITNALAFADEKIREINALCNAVHKGKETAADFADSERALTAFNELSARKRLDIREASSGSILSDSKRNLPFAERKAKQHEKFQLPLLPTTTIGSFPQTPEVRRTRTKWRKGEITDQQYKDFVNAEISEWIKIQEELGLDVLVHGEFERTDMVEYFGEKLDGFVFTEKAWVQSYGSRCVKPPIIYGDVAFTKPMTVEESVYAKSLTDHEVKGMLTGPVTILNWSFVRDDLPREEVTNQIALALRKEIESLEAAGIHMIQVDEPALREGLPLKKTEWDHYLNWAVNAFRVATASVEDTTQIHTHMCYCDFNHFIDAISALDADVISIETSRSHGDLVESFNEYHYDKGIGLGVYDIHSPRVPAIEEMTAIIDKGLEVLDPSQFWINPDCGLKTRKREETIAALEHMVKATEQARERLGVTATK
ncbi:MULTISPECIES: 5-methyltetrahydropteroyltriglutamate--homocysteine S-methyltransferase [unclassified Sporosarcina]|uniref:5-methyltetrahydropteroyltriglutamate-- homocysteine S-methyltransferase n=1 Tax=unclassified Sporosarcina TaxID=2647733 RepID=UPI002041560B|nr:MULTISPECIES: 5-methyltetrahydropteroyltriglutamate--homocysteine S-methyltransferase [unclassified Sporosarcina]GKV66790.1 5-methyltetrahydropteroyltriglutamate--homocysteine methyltransferase [Sporosarcina sp. NCCP-2331]GLB57139.1 5-methyltetrahydropteroyltriglutamate--homocysteine methyltransferase [Sporosarcina sp. NCCP-2378]